MRNCRYWRCICMICIVCDKEFIMGKNPKKKFCSSACKSRYRTTSGARVNTHLWTNFRIRESDYNEMLIHQNFRCAICKIHQSEVSRAFAVDHDHKCCSGKKSCGKCIRGLLCFECNIGLGKFKDDSAIVQTALQYLNSFK